MGFNVTAYGAASSKIDGIETGFDRAVQVDATHYDIYFKDGTVIHAELPSGTLTEDDVIRIAGEYFDAHKSEFVTPTNLKTVNGNSLIGSGDIRIEGGGGDVSAISDYREELVGNTCKVIKTSGSFNGFMTKVKNTNPSKITTRCLLTADGTVTLFVKDESLNTLCSTTRTVKANEDITLSFPLPQLNTSDESIYLGLYSTSKMMFYGANADNEVNTDVVDCDSMNGDGNYYTTATSGIDSAKWTKVTSTTKHYAYSYAFDLYHEVLRPFGFDYNMTYLYVSPNYSTSDSGFGVKYFNTIYDANESITDNAKNNRYTIIVGQGIYSDLQERFKNARNSDYQGVICKDYVYYESENITRPDLCVIRWDGCYNMTDSEKVVNNIIGKCPFHIITTKQKEKSEIHTHIKGFTFECVNARYALHMELTGASTDAKVLVENCICKFGGRPNVSDKGTDGFSVCGCGSGFYADVTFKNCVFGLTENAEQVTKAWYMHDNDAYISTTMGLPTIAGTNVEMIGCDFSNLIVQVQTTKEIAYNGFNTMKLIGCNHISSISNYVKSGINATSWYVDSAMSKIG